MRDAHRGQAERVLERAVQEEVRRSGGRADGAALLARGRAALDELARTAAEEYEAYARALDEAEAGRVGFAQRYAAQGGRTPWSSRRSPPSPRSPPTWCWAPGRAPRSARVRPWASSARRRPW